MDMELEANKEEALAIATLNRLAKRWPKSLWLFSAAGDLHVMKYNPEGKRYMWDASHGEEVDQGAILATIKIPNDGR